MKLGFVSDSLAHLPLEAMLDAAVGQGLQGVEINTGGWSSAPHFDLKAMKSSADARAAFRRAFTSRGLEIIALNANGNQLHPVSGAQQAACLEDTIRIAGEIGVTKVCCMSGLPGGAPGDTTPNWIVSSWPPETQAIIMWQWEEVLLPYWRKLTAIAKTSGVERFAVELHGNQLVYNVPSLLKLRQAVGPMVGANLDPSHLFWMGADPLAAVSALAGAVHHVHAKDTMLNAPVQATTSLLENGGLTNVAARSWSYITLGYGHGEAWWRAFCYRLRLAGYDGWLSIEHEDVMLSRMEGLAKSVALLKNVAPAEASDYAPPEI
jgi:sugar phosphate isomerase/epimerase